MTSPLTSIPNIGPATATAFAKAGIDTAEELRALGAHEAYRRWLVAGLPPHFIGYYVLAHGPSGPPLDRLQG